MYALPDSFGNLKNLEVLNLSRNFLMAVPNTFSELHNLSTLDLDCNQLQYFPKVNHLSKLVHLSLQNNQIKSSDFGEGEFPSLQRLILFGNEIKKFKSHENTLKKLEHIDLEKNKLEKFPTSLLGIPNLSQVFMSDNKIKLLPKKINNLTKLKLFCIASNQITEIPQTFSLLTNLKDLDISFNPVCNQYGTLKEFMPFFEKIPSCKMNPPKETVIPPSTPKRTPQTKIGLKSLFNNQAEQEESSSESDTESQNPEKELLDLLEDGPLLGVVTEISDFGVFEDMNKAGMIRGKKEAVVWKNKPNDQSNPTKKYQMEDYTYAECPFKGFNNFFSYFNLFLF